MMPPRTTDPKSPLFGNYRAYPQEYLEIVEKIEAVGVGKELAIPGFTQGQALAARRRFHRFRETLVEAAALEGERYDPFARHMAGIVNNIIVSIPDPRGSDYSLVFRLDPLVAAIRKMEPTP